MIGAFVLIVAASVAAGIFAGGFTMYMLIPLGVVLGALVAFIIFGRRAQKSVYRKAEGQTGAAAWALDNLRGKWRVTPGVAATGHFDAVHRVIGRPGVIFVGEGSPARVKPLLAQEKKRTARLVGDIPIYDIVIGNGEGEVPLAKLERHLTKLPANITVKQMDSLESRLAALGTKVGPAAMPKGPLPAAAKMRGVQRTVRRSDGVERDAHRGNQMCTACEWAPHFAAFGSGSRGHLTRRTLLRAAAVTAATRPVRARSSPVRHAEPAPVAPDPCRLRVPQRPDLHGVAPRRRGPQAVAVTGKHDHLRRRRGGRDGAGRTRDTRVIDLDGRLLMPGFVEGHIHPFLGAFLTSGVDLQVPTGADALAAIEQYAKDNPDGPVRGFGWRVDMFGPDGPTRADLDRVLPDRPGFFFAIDGHSLWVNSKALEIAGVTRDSQDPIPGFSYYARDQNGDPTGYVLEVDAVLGIVNAIEPISAETMGDAAGVVVAEGVRRGDHLGLRRRGAAHRRRSGRADQPLHRRREAEGALPFRVVASYSVKVAACRRRRGQADRHPRAGSRPTWYRSAPSRSSATAPRAATPPG